MPTDGLPKLHPNSMKLEDEAEAGLGIEIPAGNVGVTVTPYLPTKE